MNFPNIISLIRILLSPIIIILMIISPIKNDNFWPILIKSINIKNYNLPISWLIAAILFIIAAISDFIDGFWARKFKKVTDFGKLFDSIADKILINNVLIVMTCANIIPIWMVIIFILRDFIIDAIRQILATKNTIIASDKYGKLKTIMQILGIIILFFFNWRFLNGNKDYHYNNKYNLINQILMIPMYISIGLSIFSSYKYIILNKKKLLNLKK